MILDRNFNSVVLYCASTSIEYLLDTPLVLNGYSYKHCEALALNTASYKDVQVNTIPVLVRTWEYSINPNYLPKRSKTNSLPRLISLYEPYIRHVYSPYHYCNVCKARGLMPNVTAGCYADFVKQIRALTVQLSPKICSVKMAVP